MPQDHLEDEATAVHGHLSSLRHGTTTRKKTPDTATIERSSRFTILDTMAPKYLILSVRINDTGT